MKSAPNKHELRTAQARAKLIKAAIEMIAQGGLPGFALTNVGAKAGVSRGLATYHFTDRSQLVEAVFAGLLEDDAQPEGLGLAALLAWARDQAERAARRDPELLALLQLAVGPGVENEAPGLRKAYWNRRGHLIERHLAAAQSERQVRDDIELCQLASTVLGLVHGELLRIAATGEAPSPAFTSLIERALAPERPAVAKRAPKAAPPPPAAGPEVKPPAKPVQGTLFG